MSYPQNSYGGPPPQQQGYNGPPYPPQGQYQHPPQGQYQQHPQQQQQQYAPPPPQYQGYPPQQTRYYAAPEPPFPGPGSGMPPPPQNWPPAQYPPPASSGPPPQNQYAYNQHQQHAPPPGPPPGAFQQPPPPQNIIPTPPSLGYDPSQRAPGTAESEATALRKAMKGWGTDEAALISILSTPDPLQMALIRHTYTESIGRDLLKDLKSETSGNFETALLALAGGPLEQDIKYLKDAMSGMGTDEDGVSDVLLGRSNADLRAIKYAYVHRFGKSLVDDVKSDLSGKTEKFFLMVLDATRPERGAYFDPQSVEADIREIHQATEGRSGTDEVGVSAVFLGASEPKLVSIAQAFESRYHVPLEKVIRDEFSGHLKSALLSLLAHASDSVRHDAERVAEAVGAKGSVDEKRLIYWVVHLHWNRPYLEAVKGCLKHMGVDFGRLVKQGVSSGDFQELILRTWG